MCECGQGKFCYHLNFLIEAQRGTLGFQRTQFGKCWLQTLNFFELDIFMQILHVYETYQANLKKRLITVFTVFLLPFLIENFVTVLIWGCSIFGMFCCTTALKMKWRATNVSQVKTYYAVLDFSYVSFKKQCHTSITATLLSQHIRYCSSLSIAVKIWIVDTM